jgi:hypothetical protein
MMGFQKKQRGRWILQQDVERALLSSFHFDPEKRCHLMKNLIRLQQTNNNDTDNKNGTTAEATILGLLILVASRGGGGGGNACGCGGSNKDNDEFWPFCPSHNHPNMFQEEESSLLSCIQDATPYGLLYGLFCNRLLLAAAKSLRENQQQRYRHHRHPTTTRNIKRC